jgi:hypothetical protein
MGAYPFGSALMSTFARASQFDRFLDKQFEENSQGRENEDFGRVE